MTLICSTFDRTQGYLASAVSDFDACKIRIQQVSAKGSGAFSNVLTLEKNTQITCLTWGNLQPSSTIFKQDTPFPQLENQNLIIGLSTGTIIIFSPTTSQTICELKSVNGVGISGVHFSDVTGTLWSIDALGEITEWDMFTFSSLRSFRLDVETIPKRVLVLTYQNETYLLAASHSVHLINLNKNPKQVVHTFPGHVSFIHTLLPIKAGYFATSAENDRFINIFSLEKLSVEKVLVAQSEVSQVSYGDNADSDLTIITAVTQGGDIEYYVDPLGKSNVGGSSLQRKKRKNLNRSKNSDGAITIQRPSDKNAANETLSFENSLVTKHFVVVAWCESGHIPYFDHLKWWTRQDDEAVYTIKPESLVKEKPSFKPENNANGSHDPASALHYNEGNAIVTSGDNFRELETEAESTETLAEQLKNLSHADQKPRRRPVTGTLTSVLTQSLKSNDHSLLEMVLNNRDETVIKQTIIRLQPMFVNQFLNRVSERIARNSNRQGELNIWLKWILIIHGNYLLSYPNLQKELSTLHATLTRRANLLPLMMTLQSKLAMNLEGLTLKRELELNDEANNQALDEDAVEYVEEFDDLESSELEESSDDESEQSGVDEALDEVDDYSDVEVNGS